MARLRRTLLTSAALLVFLMLAGATYQGAATALERLQFPHTGKLVDIGGHQLHIYCTGRGSPTVVLEAPAAGMSAAWGWVQPDVAQVTRVCSYDRAGLGWSEAGNRPYDPSAVAEELHELLGRGGERGPYVMVGHGLGAALVTLYAAQFGADTAALVLIDPPSPETEGAQVTSVVRLANAAPWLARTGVLRVTRMMSGNAAGLPEPSAGALTAFLNRPAHLARAARELSQWDDTVRRAATANIGLRLPIIRVNAAGSGRAALLAERGPAKIAATAIANLVADVSKDP